MATAGREWIRNVGKERGRSYAEESFLGCAVLHRPGTFTKNNRATNGLSEEQTEKRREEIKG